MCCTRVGVAAAAALAMLGSVYAGPLSPPAGPITSTYKTLGDVEARTPIQSLGGNASALYVVSASGSYYLTGNITAQPGKRGIFIAASDVVLDLNGFTLFGGSTGDDAILVVGTNVTVRNGAIRDWVKEGVDAFGSNNVCVQDVTVTNSSAGYGIIAGDNSRFSNCTVTNSAAGFIAGQEARAGSCLSRDNATAGFQFGAGANLSDCSAMATTGGAPAFNVGDESVLNGCIARHCSGSGFLIGASARVHGCIAQSDASSGTGFAIGSGSRLEESEASWFELGVQLQGQDAAVEGCQVRAVARAIEDLGGRARIVGNNLSTRSESGVPAVRLSALCVFRGNVLEHAGDGPGVQVTNVRNRIEDNTIFMDEPTANSLRIEFTSGYNVVVRNHGLSNPTDIGGASLIAPVVSFGATTTDPWANFE